MKTDPFAKFRRQPRSGYTVTRDREPGVTSRNTENTENLRQNPELVTRLHELHQKTDDVRAHDDDRDGDQRADENSPDIHHFSCNRCNCVTESEEPAETLTFPSTKPVTPLNQSRVTGVTNQQLHAKVVSAGPVDRAIEATFRPTAADPVWPQVGAEVVPLNPEFPPCPECGATRYWISGGRVLCGSRRCYSAVRFILTWIEYHPVH